MQLKDFTDQQNTVLFGLAVRLTLADDTVPLGEDRRIAQLRERIGLDLKADMNDIYSDSNVGLFDSPPARRRVLYELLLLAHADQRLDPRELMVIDGLSKAMSVPAEEVALLKSLAEEESDIDRNGATAQQRASFNTKVARQIEHGTP
ncbi:MAG: hypothetical protein ACPGOY_09390 [Rhodospirillaceae bacterium]